MTLQKSCHPQWGQLWNANPTYIKDYFIAIIFLYTKGSEIMVQCLP